MPPAVGWEANGGSIGEARVAVLEDQRSVAAMNPNSRMLSANAFLRLLYVGEVGVEGPPELELESFLRDVDDRRTDVECRDAHAIGKLDVQSPLRQSTLVPRLVGPC